MKRHKATHLGRKILYSAVIGMSGLILLFSVIGILGVWLVQGPLSDAAVSLLHVVESSARVGRVSVGRVDQALAAFQAQVTDVVDASSQLSQNVTDKGLVLVLLPEEMELQLVETAGSIQDTYRGLRESIALGLDMYRSLNRLPFVSLPGPDDDVAGLRAVWSADLGYAVVEPEVVEIAHRAAKPCWAPPASSCCRATSIR